MARKAAEEMACKAVLTQYETDLEMACESQARGALHGHTLLFLDDAGQGQCAEMEAAAEIDVARHCSIL